MKQWRFFFFLSILLVLTSCAPFISKRISQTFERPRPCEEFLNQLDAKVKEAGVRDASNVSIPGFPYLRTNRFLTALKENLKDEREKKEWIRWMQQLDLQSRRKEISNLPGEVVLSLGAKGKGESDREGLFARVESCSSELLSHDQTRKNFYTALYPLLHVPDEYSRFRRTIGLYPLMALPVAMATHSSRKKIRSWFDVLLNDLPIDGQLKTFVPEKKVSSNGKEIQEMIRESMRNLLNVPLLNEDKEKKIVESFAPIFIQDIAASYDRMGQVVWKDHRVEVNPEKPTVYYYISHAFLKGKPIFQINYVIWFSERAGKRPPSIEQGHLDGLTARVSLNAEGRPFMVDGVNDCGCYHFFAPEKGQVDRVLSQPFRFDPFISQWLPTVPPAERLGIRMNSGWHQVQRLIPVGETLNAISYELVPYDVLEALPHEDGRRESIFDARGIVKGSERVERLILFSMGIPSIGSMRQRGHHAIDLIGRVHFDDPYLFDQNFVFK